jgi:death-on-curing protein
MSLTPTYAEVLHIAQRVGAGAVRDPGRLEAAVARPAAGFGGVEFYPTPMQKAAALVHAIAESQAIVDGNKRTALIAGALVLDRIGLRLVLDPEATVIYFASLNERTVDEVASWLEANAAPRH